jgi:tetratricopeptide (TPR) repeat protein
MTIQEAIKQGVQHHQAGRAAEAEAIYRQVLRQDRNHSDALHLLGVLALQAGRLDEAIDSIGRAIALKADVSSYHLNLGVALDKSGRLDEAIASYQKSLALRREGPKALSNLGDALRRKGRLDESLQVCRAAAKFGPNLMETHQSLGLVLLEQRQFEQALSEFAKAVSIQPDFVAAHMGAGQVFLEMDRPSEAVAAYRMAAALRPDDAEALNGLGGALFKDGAFEQAIEFVRRAIALRPDLVEAHNNLGLALYRLGCYEAAIAAFGKAIDLRPQFHQAHNNLGNVYYTLGKLDQAVSSYQTALKLWPDYAMAHHNLGVILMLRGDLQQGWKELDWGPLWQPNPRRAQLTKPLWDGSELGGRRILIHAEQGFGDAIQFIRYLPRVIAKGGEVQVACQRELHRLFQPIGPKVRWIAPDEPLAEHDVRSPLMGLPRIFDTTLENIPATIPYLAADVELAQQWGDRLSKEPGKKIGLAWAGRPKDINDRERSITLAHLAPLAQVPGLTFISLQKGDASAQAANPPAGMKLLDWTDELKDFADTAALIASLDLVIAVDMVVVHLAGALGKPVWMLLQCYPDWRWLLDRADSPWYPTMRIFRQPRLGDWNTPIAQVSEALQRL